MNKFSWNKILQVLPSSEIREIQWLWKFHDVGVVVHAQFYDLIDEVSQYSHFIVLFVTDDTKD